MVPSEVVLEEYWEGDEEEVAAEGKSLVRRKKGKGKERDEQDSVNEGGVETEQQHDHLFEEQGERPRERDLELLRQRGGEGRVEVEHGTVDSSGLGLQLGGATAKEDGTVRLGDEGSSDPHGETEDREDPEDPVNEQKGQLPKREMGENTEHSPAPRDRETDEAADDGSLRVVQVSVLPRMEREGRRTRTGPAKGARAKSDMARARSEAEKRSLMIPPLLVRGAEPKKPARNLRNINVSGEKVER